MAVSRLLVIVVSLVLLLAACGGEDPVGEEAAPTSAPATTDASTAGATETTETKSADPGVATPELVGTTWNVRLYLEGGAMAQLWPQTEITLSFGDGGTVSGFAGCNEYTGAFTVDGAYDPFEEGVRDEGDGQAIQITVDSVEEAVCDSPVGVMEQEAAYLVALESAGRWLIGRDVLLIRTSDGLFLVEAEPEAG